MDCSQLFVCFDLHRPAWKQATANQFDLSRSLMGTPCETSARRVSLVQTAPSRVLLILTITGFTNVLRLRQMDWKQLVKLNGPPCVHVSEHINIHTVYRVLCSQFAANLNVSIFLTLFRFGVKMFMERHREIVQKYFFASYPTTGQHLSAFTRFLLSWLPCDNMTFYQNNLILPL